MAFTHLLLLMLVFAATGNAHPLGNFSINHYSGIRIGSEAVEVRYVIDMAEVPAFQEIQEAGITATAGDPRVVSYLARKTVELRDGLALEINGEPLALDSFAREINFPPGAAGLPTLKITAVYRAKIPRSSSSFEGVLNYRDGNFAGRAGWKEIVVSAEGVAKLVSSSVPQTDRSAQLSEYPEDLLNTPPQDREARVWFALTREVATAQSPLTESPAAKPPVAKKTREPLVRTSPADDRLSVAAQKLGVMETAPVRPETPSPRPVELPASQPTPRDSFTELIKARQADWGLMVIALVVAVGLGALHALEPGHGKTLVAAYLIGSRGTLKQALMLGVIVTTTHTAGVYLLGGITLYASRYVVPEQLYPWLGLASGLMITLLGVLLVLRHYRGKAFAGSHRRAAHEHPHDHVHPHRHDHSHEHLSGGHTHGTASLRELATLGISGGIIPCPGALVVLLGAVSINRIGFGLLLIVAFSAGLAAVLIGLGLLMVYARRFMSRSAGERAWVTRCVPLASSVTICVVGLGLTWQAWRSTAFSLL